MKLSFALSTLLVVLDSQGAESQSLALRQGAGGKTRNFGSVRLTKLPSHDDLLNLSSTAEKDAAVRRKSKNGFEVAVTASSNRRSLSPSSNWVEAATFEILPNSQNGGYKLSMSRDGTFLASAPSSYSSGDDGKLENGIVRFFQKQQDSEGTMKWTERTDLQLTGVADFDFFGSDISFSGNGQRVAIGASGDGGKEEEAMFSGSVSVYEMLNSEDGSEWKLLGIIFGEGEFDQSGHSVALSKDGKTLAIGSPGNNANSGHVRVYQWDNGKSSFNQLGGDIDGEAANGQAGFSVAISEDGSVVAIGAPAADFYTGQVHVFYWDVVKSNWSQRGSAIFGEGRVDFLGSSVDLSDDGNILAVGARNGKYVMVFQWQEDSGKWEPIAEALTGGGDESFFGYSVSLSTPSSGSTIVIVVGSEFSSYTYTLGNNSNEWEELAGEVPGSEVVVSSDGKTLAVGDPLNTNDGGGSVIVYDLTSVPTSDPTTSPIPTSDPTISPIPTSGPTLVPSPPSGSNGDPHCKRPLFA
eukprot:scaffold3297_cov132-Cylindrotheca_fusiformis.AAC.5